MTGQPWQREQVTVTLGDCVEVLRARTGPLFDAVVTDPPYHLTSIVERFGKPGSAPAQHGTDGAFVRASRGFMGKEWDGGDVAFRPDTWRAVFDQMKPGAHLAAFSGTRTYHRMACAIEDAGFEIRDQLAWVYGSGFPKSAGLKPAWEPICLARKPCEGTRKANIAAHGTGGLNIDACRVDGAEAIKTFERAAGNRSRENYRTGTTVGPAIMVNRGRWPTNVLIDGSDEVLTGFPSETGKSTGGRVRSGTTGQSGVFGLDSRVEVGDPGFGDSGSAARFFYSAKAGPLDRLGSEHPTVKPVDLMRWLCRLVTPVPGGLILDPFAGSGTTGIAAIAEGFHAELIDMEPDHIVDIEAKLAHLRGEGGRIVERHLKRKTERAPEPLALFAGVA